MTDPDRHWRDAAVNAHALANQFARLAGEVLDRDSDDFPAVEPFVEALTLAISLRVNAWLASGEDSIALSAAEAGAESLVGLCDRLNLGEATLARMAAATLRPGESGWGEALDAEASALRRIVAAARLREAAAVSSAVMIGDLVGRGLSGRQLLQEARRKDSDAVKYLPALPS